LETASKYFGRRFQIWIHGYQFSGFFSAHVQTFCNLTPTRQELGGTWQDMLTKLRPALAAFRRLMRAREMAFKGDNEMLVQSRLAVREEFLRHKVALSLPCGGSQIGPAAWSAWSCGCAVHVLTSRVAQDVHDGPTLTELLQGADEATDMLKHHLVQGVRKGEGEYAMNIDPARHVTMDPNKMPGEKWGEQAGKAVVPLPLASVRPQIGKHMSVMKKQILNRCWKYRELHLYTRLAWRLLLAFCPPRASRACLRFELTPAAWFPRAGEERDWGAQKSVVAWWMRR
jgi:hypothetical protein